MDIERSMLFCVTRVMALNGGFALKASAFDDSYGLGGIGVFSYEGKALVFSEATTTELEEYDFSAAHVNQVGRVIYDGLKHIVTVPCLVTNMDGVRRIYSGPVNVVWGPERMNAEVFDPLCLVLQDDWIGWIRKNNESGHWLFAVGKIGAVVSSGVEVLLPEYSQSDKPKDALTITIYTRVGGESAFRDDDLKGRGI